MRREEIESLLSKSLELAKTAHKDAARDFRAACADIPSGLPGPDGRAKIDIAGIAYRSTMDTYARALREYSDFISYGTVPASLSNGNR
jgi:hypothetical protein